MSDESNTDKPARPDWWTDTTEEMYQHASVLTYGPDRARSCCGEARGIFCVCELATLCPVHGYRHHGTHD